MLEIPHTMCSETGGRVSEMAAKAVASLGSEGAHPKWPVGYVAVDGVAARRSDADPLRPPAARAHRAYLEAPEPPPDLASHHWPH